MDIGTHCTYCGRLDFLPFDCRKCGKVVCGEHRTNHDCVEEKVLPLPDKREPARAAAKTQPKAQPKAQPRAQPKAQPPRAPAEQTGARADGGVRLGGQAGSAKSERAMAAFERLKTLVGGSGRSNAAPKTAARARPAASPAAPAELKKTAAGDPHVKFADRMYYRVERPAQHYKDPLTGTQGTRPAKTVPLYFDKSLTLGQVLDKAAAQLGFSARGAGLRRVDGGALDLRAPISGVPQGATLVVTL